MYFRIDKFMRGLERVMLVVTIIDPNPLPGTGFLQSIRNTTSKKDTQKTTKYDNTAKC